MTTRKQQAAIVQPRIPLTPQEREIARKAMIDAIRNLRAQGQQQLAANKKAA